jgi:GntR family transcriptional regulator
VPPWLWESLVPPLRHPRLLTAVAADDLRRAIDAGEFEGGQLPSEPELARRMGISRATLRQAITELEESGLVRRRHGKGTFVTGHAAALRNILNENSGTSDLIRAAGWLPTTTDVVPVTRPAASREVQALALQLDDEVLSIRRTRQADGRPAVAVEDVLPRRRLVEAGIETGRLVEDLSIRASLYDLLDEGGLAVHHGIADIRAAQARGDVARRLGVEPGTAVILLDQVDTTADGVDVLFSREWYAPDVFQFRVYRRGPGSRR